MYVHIYTHVCIYVYVYMCICAYAYTCMYVSMYVYLSIDRSIYLSIYVSMYICVYVSLYLCIYVSMCLCIYMHIYVCVFICVFWYMYVYIYIHVYACGLVTVPQIHTSASDSLGWGGVGWDDNVIGISTWSWCYALWSSLAIPHDLDATLYDLHWHFHMILMLRSMIFIGNSTWSWCYALWSYWHFWSWCWIFIGNSTWSWCYALWSSLAFPHDLDATLYDLHWHFHMILMLRSMIFNCHCTHPHPIVWGGAGRGGVGWGGMITSFPRLGSILAYGLCVTETLYISRWHIHADMNTLTIFSFRLLDPPEWACRRVCNVE